MKKSLIVSCLLLVIQLFNVLNAQIERPIGTNLTGIVDYSSEYVFVDVFKQSREWISHDNVGGAPWSSGVHIPLGPNGYPLEIPYNDGIHHSQGIRTLMFFGELEGKYPEGNYRLIVSGTGKIRFWGAASGLFNCPVDTFVSVDSDIGGIALEIEESISSDPIRDIRFIMPGFENTYDKDPFNPKLIDFIDDFQLIRFMDWMKTNGSNVTNWKDRNTENYFSQTVNNGVAAEYIIDLCNQTHKDAWICIPHKATDDYIELLAQLFRDSLDSSLKLYVEYSNEVWNGIFSQSRYADSLGNVLGYSGNPWEQGWKYYAKRTADVHQIFESEFGNNNQLVKVISSQAANPWVTNYIIERYKELQYNPTQVQADAIATAPYFAGGVANNIAEAGLENSISVEAILDSMESSMAETYDWMIETKELADQHDLDFITYEGGQHLVAGWQYNNNEAFVDKLILANQDERMEEIYCNYFNFWYENAQGGMFCHFSSHAFPSKYGSWGVKEHLDDTLAPKYLGLKECVFKYNTFTTSTKAKEDVKYSNLKVHPIPSKGIITIEHQMINPSVFLLDNTGNAIIFSSKYNTNEIILNVENYLGFAIIVLNDGDEILTKKILLLE